MNKIKEGNELIAEFMGAKMIVTDYHGVNIIEFPDKSTKDLFGLKYHSSWDWLIPVIDKATSLDKYYLYVAETSAYCMIGGIYINTKFIESTWENVVDFIKWYNENK